MPTSSKRVGAALSVRGIGKAYNVSSRQATTVVAAARAPTNSGHCGMSRAKSSRARFSDSSDATEPASPHC